MDGQDVQAFKTGLNLRSNIRTMTKPPVVVAKPSRIMDPREVAFRHFTEIPSIDKKKKSKWGYRPKSENNNTFAAFLGVPVDKSTVAEVPTCKSTGVAASKISPSSRKLSVEINASASSVCPLIKQTENGDEETSAKTPTNSDRPMTKTIDMNHDPKGIDGGIRRTKLKRKALVKKVNPIDLLVAMFNDLTLDDKRKIKESQKEHFETFHAHRLNARPYAKRMKPLNN